MARTETEVRRLVREDPEMEAAIRTVLDAAEDGEVQWRDVKDDLTTGQWGRLIQQGVLDEGEEGFVVEDPEAVRDGLAEPEEGDDDAPDVSWSTWDKIAGLFALSLFPGYYLGSVRNFVGRTLDVVLGQVDAMLPFYIVILLLAVFTGLWSTLLQAYLLDRDKLAYYQNRMQEIQEREKRAKERGDEEEIEEIRQEQMEAMGENIGMFKEQFRPMPWTMVLVIPAFLWMYWKLQAGHIATAAERQLVLPLVGETGIRGGVVGPMPAWIVWYFLCSLGFSQIVRKALNVQMQPGGDDDGDES